MRNSIFTKYMLAFAAIVLISFLLLAVINSTIINDYATDSLREEVDSVAAFADGMLEMGYRSQETPVDFSEFVLENKEEFNRLLIGVGSLSTGKVLLMTDRDGAVLYGANVDENAVVITEGKKIPGAVMRHLLEQGEYATNDTMGGFFATRHVISALAVTDSEGEVLGGVFSCASFAAEDAMIRGMNRTVVMASVWVMLAAMIAVYFITDRITSPLRYMTAAAKGFARGEMDRRVEVQGSDEVAELGTAFNSMADALAENEKMRNAFLANVSHDLRTPMTTIAGFVDGMLSGAIPEEKQPEYLEIVSSEVHRLSRLVSQLLDVSRLESGERKFKDERFDICEMARLILISFEKKIEEKRLEVEFRCESDSMLVYGDRDATHQVLYNLCDNAIKFAREEGVLRIEISTQSVGQYGITVYNEGTGIPEEDLPYVFERFYKSDKSRSLDKNGVGLGLYIVKTIMDAMGQTIHAESEYGKWCAFHFTLRQDRSE